MGTFGRRVPGISRKLVRIRDFEVRRSPYTYVPAARTAPDPQGGI